MDISNKREIFALFYSIIVKGKNELDLFKESFDSFFMNLDINIDFELYKNTFNNTNNDNILKSVLSSYKFKKYTYNSTVKALILNDKNRIDRLIRLAISNLNEITLDSLGQSFNKVKNNLNINELENDILIIKDELRKTNSSESEIDAIINKIIQKLKSFKKNIRRELKSKLNDLEISNSQNLEFNLSNLDSKIIENSAKKFAEKLKKKKSRQFKKSKYGLIDIRKTLNKSISYNNIPLKRFYKKQKLKKRELIILADTSDSVKKYSKTILFYIYSLNNFFKEIKTFTFVSNVVEITDEFKSDLSFDEIMKTSLNNSGNSDYNSSFESFTSSYISYLNKNVIFIIIGDARNNYFSAELKNLLMIQKKVRDIIWLNPDNKVFWNATDSNMFEYSRIINHKYQVKTIKDIEKFSESIILK